MAHVSQADFARAARGGEGFGEDSEIEPILGGLSSVSKKAVRTAHQESPGAALAYFNSKTLRWRLSGGRVAATVRAYADCLARYLDWDGGSGPAELDLGAKRRSDPIPFGPGNSVRAIAHVVTGSEGRVLLWDELPLSGESAAMIALPVFERIDVEIGGNAAEVVGVWQLAQANRVEVSRDEAEATRASVESLLAGM